MKHEDGASERERCLSAHMSQNHYDHERHKTDEVEEPHTSQEPAVALSRFGQAFGIEVMSRFHRLTYVN